MHHRHHTRVSAPVRRAAAAAVESLEGRQLLAVLRPDHVVVVIEQDRASNGIGHALMPYLTSLANTGLNYTNAHGVTHPSTPNALALFSGSTQGITDNGRNHSFAAPNLAKSLFDAGLSFSGYVESLPADGSQVTQAGTAAFPDLYTRNVNAMAQFTDYGINPATGLPRTNAEVNRTFGAFSSLPTTDYSSLPTVSFIVPNNLHSTHGSNEAYPWAGSPDEENNDLLRKEADNWLKANLDGYLQWAKQNNSLLIVTQDEERWTGGTASTVTTVVNGDADLFVAGTNAASINHYNVLRTIEEMYGLPLLGQSATASALATDASGRLAPDLTPPTSVATTTTLTRSVASSVSGQAVTFTATVTATGGTPTGNVTFTDGTRVLGSVAVNASGVATFTTSALAVGGHSIRATFNGPAPYTASSSTSLSHTVAKAATGVTLTSTANPANVGQSVRFIATVDVTAPGSGVATGTVQFQVDGKNFGSAVTLVNGVATSAATTTLTAGNHTVKAVYAGSTSLNGSTSATFTQSVATLPNDPFAGRIALSGTSLAATGSNAGATKETGEPQHAGSAGGKSVWWTWTAAAAGTVTIDTFGSVFDTLLGVYTGTSVNALTAVASNDDAPGVYQSSLSFTAVAGRTYQIAVDGWGGQSGAITLHLTAAAAATLKATTLKVAKAATTSSTTTRTSLWSGLAIA